MRRFPRTRPTARPAASRSQGNLWIGTMIVQDGVVVHASPSRLAALAAESGKVLWEQPKKYIGHLWYEWKDVFVIDGLVWTWSAELDEAIFRSGGRRSSTSSGPDSANGYDLQTGELKKQVPTGPDLQGQPPPPLLPQQGHRALHPLPAGAAPNTSTWSRASTRSTTGSAARATWA